MQAEPTDRKEEATERERWETFLLHSLEDVFHHWIDIQSFHRRLMRKKYIFLFVYVCVCV